MMKKRNIVLSLFFLIVGLQASAQVFIDSTLNRVIRIEGRVTNQNKGMALERGAAFLPGDQLRFATPDSRIFFISPEKELLMALPNEGLSGYTVEPVRSKYNTRPGKILTYIAFVKFLEGRKWLVLGGSVQLEVGREEFPLDDNHFFFIRYNLEGEANAVNKKLSHQGQLVLFSKQEIYQVDGKPVMVEKTRGHELLYYNALKPKSTTINTIRLVFPDEEVIRQEVEGLIRYLGEGFPDEDKVPVIENFLFEAYGTPEKENLKEWLKLHFKL